MTKNEVTTLITLGQTISDEIIKDPKIIYATLVFAGVHFTAFQIYKYYQTNKVLNEKGSVDLSFFKTSKFVSAKS